MTMWNMTVDRVGVTVTPVNPETGIVRTSEGKYVGCVSLSKTEFGLSPVFSDLCKVVNMWQIATGGV